MTEHERVDGFDLAISPEPSTDERDAILAAVERTLAREAELARPAAWRLSGWIDQRIGITDINRWISGHRRWPLSPRMPRGGRIFPGLNGRGDAK